jgi:superfamily II DNA/RNA helicase
MPSNPRRPRTSSARPSGHPSAGGSRGGSSSRSAPHRSSSSRNSSGRNRTPNASSTREDDRQLEAWFAEAAAGAAVTETSFGKLGLPQALVTALERREIRTAMPIQAATLPAALEGRDVIGRAQTGSGKTLGFGLPMIARLSGSSSQPTAPRGLVLVPTRELAVQVREALEPLGHAVGVKTVAVFGGAPLGRQIQTLQRGVDIIVATPGRLLDLIERRACTLSNIEITVLDEADHMADMGFLPDVTRLLDMTPAGTQRMLFSATLDGAVGRVVRDYLSNPVARAVASADALIDTMEHRALVVRSEDKVNVLAEIAQRPARTLMFVRTKHGADRLVKQFGRLGIEALAIHGNRTQAARQKALDTFARGQVRLLVATDVAARGIHIADVDLVVHVDPPNDHKDYLHRSGRTARAGASGVVVSMLTRDQVREARNMFGRAGVDIQTVEAATGSEVVRLLAESGEAIVIAPAPAGRSTSSSDRYDGDRGARRGSAPRRGGPNRNGNGNRNGSGGSRPYGRRAA